MFYSNDQTILNYIACLSHLNMNENDNELVGHSKMKGSGDWLNHTSVKIIFKTINLFLKALCF